MENTDNHEERYISIKYYVIILIAIWSLVIGASFWWNAYQGRREVLSMAELQARVAHKKDVIYRRWNAEHGGVYVPVSEKTKLNPYLETSKREIADPSGRLLALINPAYMTRQVHELGEQAYGVYGHITSLNPIRPENAPDSWENQALKAFEQGIEEVSSIEKVGGEPHMRLMRPLITEEGCMKCHAKQGYKVGDIRGGISVAIPMAPLWEIALSRIRALLAGHGVIWLIGMLGIGIGARRLGHHVKERRKAEVTLRETNRKLVETESLKEDLTNMIVHDMKNPLTNAMLGIDVIQLGSEQNLTEQQRDSFTLVKRNQLKLSEMITNLLEISKLETGALEINKIRVHLLDLINRTVDRFQPAMKAKELTMNSSIDPSVEWILCDDHLLDRVIANVLSNAIKHSHPGNEIIVRALPDEGKRGALISVQDFGEGIPKKYHQKIFEKFGQADMRELGQKTDTGLGLAFCKMAVEVMGGNISVESEPGKGSCFTFSLPEAHEYN